MNESTVTNDGADERKDNRLLSNRRELLAGAGIFAFLAILPPLLEVSVFGLSIGNVLGLQALIVALVFATAGQAWNLLSGYTGYFSFGHAAFFGIGAYVTLLLASNFSVNPWIGMFLGALLAALVGVLISYLNFRYDLREHYFALATFAFAMLIMVTVSNTSRLGGAIGIYKPFPDEYGAEYGLMAFQFQSDFSYYYLILAFLVIVTIIAWLLKNSQIGLYLFAIREDENAASSVGIPALRYKIFATALSAFFTAWAGAYWSMYYTIIRPDTVFELTRNVEILLPAVVGGMGTVMGPVLGALTIFPLAEAVRITFDQFPGLHLIVYGISLVLIAIYLPNGIISLRTYLER